MVTRLLVAVAVAVIGPLGAVQTAHADTNDTKFIALLKLRGNHRPRIAQPRDRGRSLRLLKT